jgi:hypothetical protein
MSSCLINDKVVTILKTGQRLLTKMLGFTFDLNNMLYEGLLIKFQKVHSKFGRVVLITNG